MCILLAYAAAVHKQQRCNASGKYRSVDDNIEFTIYIDLAFWTLLSLPFFNEFSLFCLYLDFRPQILLEKYWYTKVIIGCSAYERDQTGPKLQKIYIYIYKKEESDFHILLLEFFAVMEYIL